MTDREMLSALSTMMDEKLDPMKQDISELKADVSELKTDVTELKTDVAVLKTDVVGLKNDVSVLKTDVSRLETSVSRLETNVSRLETDVAGLKTSVKHIELHLETEIDSQIQLLVENYVPAAKRFEREADTISEMRTDIVLLKTAVQNHSELLHNLA